MQANWNGPWAHLAVGLALLVPGCESQLDDKPSAEVGEEIVTQKGTAAPAEQAPSEGATALSLVADKSKLEFVGAKVTGDHRGRFTKLTGTAQLGADGAIKTAEVTADLNSLQIDPPKLLAHLKSPDFFDVKKFPKATFKLTNVAAAPDGEHTHKITGELELHGVKKPISFPAKVELKGDRASARAAFKINRKDFGITYPGMPDDLIKDEVLLDLALEFEKQK